MNTGKFTMYCYTVYFKWFADMYAVFFSRNQSQKSLHLADCSWRYIMCNCVFVLESAVTHTLSGSLRCHFCYVYQTKLLKKAMTMLDNEKQFRKDERERTLAERVPGLQMSGLSLQDLQVHSSLKHFNPQKDCFWFWLLRKSKLNYITV